MTLAQLSSTAADPQGLGQEDVGAMAGELIDGAGGLSQLAKSVASTANDFVQRLSALEGPLGLDQSMAKFKTAGATLEQHASAIAGMEARDLTYYQAATATAAQSARAALDDLELSAANVSAAAVLANLISVMRSMGEQWQAVSGNMSAAVAGASKQELGDPEYLRQTLGLDDAVAGWKALADSTTVFIQKSLTP